MKQMNTYSILIDGVNFAIPMGKEDLDLNVSTEQPLM